MTWRVVFFVAGAGASAVELISVLGVG